ncbi:RUN domain-containing protein [Cavenderia fasciculata]|uniref:RUN domain-containing protein n=1 Tax=Cavenderia fasciculata TaxID=261658 RepID=F4PVD1_CACFS|nr:RUN domain-containing protein [Cavenderia fasciculata]EGG19945.1 RUN domain-containing protein [Cavenderia fasciculata]|eukprot:XP_004366928.1 RUN domain-containing protein [Cavenderia fasciculata]
MGRKNKEEEEEQINEISTFVRPSVEKEYAESVQAQTLRKESQSKLKVAIKECVSYYFSNNSSPITNTIHEHLLGPICYQIEAFICHKLKQNSKIWEIIQLLPNLKKDLKNPLLADSRAVDWKEEFDYINSSSEVTSDLGKARAWIRRSLNESILNQAIEILTSNQDIIKTYYQEDSILRHKEDADLFRSILVSLATLQFQIDYNNSKLDHVNIDPSCLSPLHPFYLDFQRQHIIVKDDNESTTSSSSSSSSTTVGPTKVLVKKKKVLKSLTRNINLDGEDEFGQGEAVAVEVQAVPEKKTKIIKRITKIKKVVKKVKQEKENEDQEEKEKEKEEEINPPIVVQQQQQEINLSCNEQEEEEEEEKVKEPIVPIDDILSSDEEHNRIMLKRSMEIQEQQGPILTLMEELALLDPTTVNSSTISSNSSISSNYYEKSSDDPVPNHPPPPTTTTTHNVSDFIFSQKQAQQPCHHLSIEEESMVFDKIDQFEQLLQEKHHLQEKDDNIRIHHSSTLTVSVSTNDIAQQFNYSHHNNSATTSYVSDDLSEDINDITTINDSMNHDTLESYDDLLLDPTIQFLIQSAKDLPPPSSSSTTPNYDSPPQTSLSSSSSSISPVNINNNQNNQNNQTKSTFTSSNSSSNISSPSSFKWAPLRKKILFTIPTQGTLQEQNYQCYGCAKDISGIFSLSRYCEYSGKYYCSGCHSKKYWYIPGKILTNWDFKQYYLANFYYEFLVEMEKEPVYDLGNVNPKLYKNNHLLRIRNLRRQMFHLKDFLITCTRGGQALLELLGRSEYLANSIDLFSLGDLVNYKQLLETLRQLVAKWLDHVEKCVLCLAKGFVCEYCDDHTAIYPYHISTVSQCSNCKSFHHNKCQQLGKQCPKCLRLAKQRILQNFEKARKLEKEKLETEKNNLIMN